jgi:hypothetical protein
MKVFHFAIMNGVDGFLPDNVEYHRAECSVDAFDAIKDAIRTFRDSGGDEFHECQWADFFERGCAAPDASQWSFTLATDGAEELSVRGMTEAEYDRECGE